MPRFALLLGLVGFQEADALRAELKKKGMNPADVNIDWTFLEKEISPRFLAYSYAAGRARSRLPITEELHRDAWRLPAWTEQAAREIRESPIRGAYATLGRGKLDVPETRPGSFLDELRKWGTPDEAAAGAVPPEVAEAAAIVLAAMRDARERAEKVRREVPPRLIGRRLFTPRFSRQKEIDAASMAAGGAAVLAAVQEAAKRLKAHDRAFSFEMPTPAGAILLKGGSDDTWDRKDVALLIDVSGKDRYAGTAGASTENCPVSVLIDVQGDDTYESEGRDGAFGAGRYGVGICADLAGNDTYRGDQAFGVGYFGVGVLLEAAGDDRYEGNEQAQGAGMYGIGILWDRGGNDRYGILQYGQGLGLSEGIGIVLDEAGDDRYLARDPINGGQVERPSAQTKEHNISMVQGAGYGDRNSGRAGGIGLLIDVAGNDEYSAGVFGQGVGFYLGAGALVDLAGNDTYETFVYGQAQGVHGGLGILLDARGNDRHKCQGWNVLALGVDFGVTWFVDREGNDEYDVTPNSTGASLGQAVAFFYEGGGNDTYRMRAAGPQLGTGQDYDATDYNQDGKTEERERRHWAFFFDAAGKDVYEGSPAPLENGKTAERNATSAAIDRE